MQLVLAIVLFLAAFGSAAYVATLAGVPTRLRLSAASVPVTFLFAYCILVNAKEHLPLAFAMVGLSVSITAMFALHFVYTHPLTKEERMKLVFRTLPFVIVVAIVAAIGTGLGWRIQPVVPPAPATSTAPADTIQPVRPADDESSLLDSLYNLAR